MTDPAPPKADPEAPELAVRERHEPEGSVRETFESIVIAFVLAFIFRAFVVEAFVIPTGSMAPTLLGQHVTLTCEQCGYRFVTGPRDHRYSSSERTQVAEPFQGVWGGSAGRGSDRPLRIDCPMCDYPIVRRTLRTDAGDRILVLKYLYALTEPRRWDVVVFKNPEEPGVNYIKRLVGLPGEQIWVVNGNVYTRPLDSPDDPWTIQRKTDRPEVQRTVWRAVYYSDFYPLDGGSPGGESPRERPWKVPWQPEGDPAAWQLQRGARWHYRPKDAGAEGVLRFSFAATDHYRHPYFPYNALEDNGYDGDGRTSLDEMRIAATVMPEHEGLQLTLMTSSHDLLIRGRVGADGGVLLETAPRSDPSAWEPRDTGKVSLLAPQCGTRVELWHVDQSISFRVAGEKVAEWEYGLEDIGLTPDVLADRGPGDQPEPLAQITVAGGPAVLRAIDLDRDLYYTQDGSLGTGTHPAFIQKDWFFCMGDNSPKSKDSRMWTEVDPWVADIRDVPPGFVPRELMIGRAFFVYYPASHQVPRSPVGVPNFGDMRFIH